MSPVNLAEIRARHADAVPDMLRQPLVTVPQDPHDAALRAAMDRRDLLAAVDAALAVHRASLAGTFADQHRPGFEPFCVGCWEAGGFDAAPLWKDCPTRKAMGVTS